MAVGQLTVADIKRRVRKTFGDEAGVQIDDADIIDWINDSLRVIALGNNLLKTKTTVNIVAGTFEYALPDMITLREVKVNGVALHQLSEQEATRFIPSNDDTVNRPRGLPTNYWVRSSGFIELYPTPDTAVTNGLLVYYTKPPAVVAADGDTPELPAPYHMAILLYCLQQANELDENWDGADRKEAQFEKHLIKTKGLQDDTQDVYPSITGSTEDISWFG